MAKRRKKSINNASSGNNNNNNNNDNSSSSNNSRANNRIWVSDGIDCFKKRERERDAFRLKLKRPIANGQMDWLHWRGQIEANTRDTPVLSLLLVLFPHSSLCITNWSYCWTQRLIFFLWPYCPWVVHEVLPSQCSTKMKMNSASQRKKKSQEGKKGKNATQDKGSVITINVMMGRTWHTKNKANTGSEDEEKVDPRHTREYSAWEST